MQFRFSSIEAPEQRAYVFDSSVSIDRSNLYSPVDPSLMFYSTYGDGMIAHSPNSPISIDMLCDYCYSLAEFLLQHQELTETVYWHFDSPVDEVMIEFASKIIYKPDKERWYSLSERKISASESKRHDRRYERVPEWADGLYESIVRILRQPHYSPLKTFVMELAVHDWFSRHGCVGTLPCFDPRADWDLRSKQVAAVRAVQDVCKAHYKLESARRMVRMHRDQVQAEANAVEEK